MALDLPQAALDVLLAGMRLTFRVVDATVGTGKDVVLGSESEATAYQASTALTKLTRPGAPPAVLHVDDAALGPQLPLSASPLRDGARVSYAPSSRRW